jgi:hypothetical protein
MTAEARDRDRRGTGSAAADVPDAPSADEPDTALSSRAGRAATVLAVAALWAGTQLALVGLGAALFAGLLPPAVPSLWYAAALLVVPAVPLVSGGGLRPAAAVACLRTRTGSVTAGVGVGVALLAALLTGTAMPALPRSVVVAVVLAQAPLVLGWWAWAAPGHPPAITHRAAVSSLVAVLVVGHAALIPVLLPDAYPFAVYTMFNEPRLDPYEGQRVVFVADADADGERTLPVNASRLALLDLARADDTDRLRDLAASLAEQHGTGEVTVYLERVRVRPPPAPPGLEVAARTELAVSGG